MPCLLVAPPNRRAPLSPYLLHDPGFKKLDYSLLGLASLWTCRRNQAMIVALRRSAQQHKLRVVEFDGQGLNPRVCRAGQSRPSLTRAPDRSDCRGEGFVRSASAHADVHTHAPFPTESQSFLERKCKHSCLVSICLARLATSWLANSFHGEFVRLSDLGCVVRLIA